MAEELRLVTGRGNRLARGGDTAYTKDAEYSLDTTSAIHILDLASTRTAPHRKQTVVHPSPAEALIPPLFFFFSIRIYAFVGVCTAPYEIVIECWIPRMPDDRCWLGRWRDRTGVCGVVEIGVKYQFLGRENGRLLCCMGFPNWCVTCCADYMAFEVSGPQPWRVYPNATTRVMIIHAWVLGLCIVCASPARDGAT